jgi:hypothetical protein
MKPSPAQYLSKARLEFAAAETNAKDAERMAEAAIETHRQARQKLKMARKWAKHAKKLAKRAGKHATEAQLVLQNAGRKLAKAKKKSVKGAKPAKAKKNKPHAKVKSKSRVTPKKKPAANKILKIVKTARPKETPPRPVVASAPAPVDDNSSLPIAAAPGSTPNPTT